MSPMTAAFNNPWIVSFWGVGMIFVALAMIFWSHYHRRHPEIQAEQMKLYAQVVKHPEFASQFHQNNVAHIGHFFYFVLAVVFMTAGVSMIMGVITGFHLDWNMVFYCAIASAVVTILLMSLKTQRSA